MDETLVTVATVVFNSFSCIEKTILSVINQSYRKIEYIIIDGGSTDGTLEIIQKYSGNISYFLTEKDSGVYDAMNKALKVANGDFLVFMNSGDTFSSDFIVESFINSKDENNAVYYGDALFFDNEKQKVYLYGGKFNKHRLLFHNICHQSVFYPKSIYKSQNFNLKYKLLADWEYNIRAYSTLTKFNYLDNVICFYNRNGISYSLLDLAFDDDFEKIVKVNFGVPVFIYYWLRKRVRIRKIFPALKKLLNPHKNNEYGK
jgi:glycosyltransferase involved in cell wall biosynthesis